MEQKKPVILWTPKRTEKRTAAGAVIPDDYVGKFATKVSEGTPGAIRNKGQNEAGLSWDFWEKHVDSINGKLRWIDKQGGGNKYGAKVVMYLESDKYLHQISIPYDKGFDLARIMNHLSGLKKDVATWNININYYVRKKTDWATKKVVTDKSGKPIWQKSIGFVDIKPEFDRDQWVAFADQHGLTSFHQTKPNGDNVWNNDAELKYWDTRLCRLQRYLLTTPDVLPFTYNSMICCEALNPSGGENLTTAEIAKAREIYEQVKGRYRFPYSRQETNADDAFEDMGERNAGIDFSKRTDKGGDANFPDAPPSDDFFDYLTAPPNNDGLEDLPF